MAVAAWTISWAMVSRISGPVVPLLIPSTDVLSRGLLKQKPSLSRPALMFSDTWEMIESGAPAKIKADKMRSLSCMSKEKKKCKSQRRIFTCLYNIFPVDWNAFSRAVCQESGKGNTFVSVLVVQDILDILG